MRLKIQCDGKSCKEANMCPILRLGQSSSSSQGISKSLLSQLGIHLLLGKQGKKDSNSLANKLGKNSNLAYLPSARANIRAPTPLAIAIFAAPPPLLRRA